QKKQDKERACTYLAEPFCPVQFSSVTKIYDSHNSHKAFLQEHQKKQINHLFISEDQTKGNSPMGQFICNRVQKLSKLCDHVKSSCHLPVQEICNIRQQDYACCQIIISRSFCPQINPAEYRYQ